MAFITTLTVPEETTKLMNSLGLFQQQCISPNVEWANLRGVKIFHTQNLIPRTVDEVLELVFNSGYNNGLYDQSKNIKESAVRVVENFIESVIIRSKF